MNTLSDKFCSYCIQQRTVEPALPRWRQIVLLLQPCRLHVGCFPALTRYRQDPRQLQRQHQETLQSRAKVRCCFFFFLLGLPYATVLSSFLSVGNVGLLWPNSWVDEDATWHGGIPRPRPHCVWWGLGTQLSPPTERGIATPPLFDGCLLWPNGRPSQQLSSSCRNIVWFMVGLSR